MASNHGSGLDNCPSGQMLRRFTSAMYISLVALDELSTLHFCYLSFYTKDGGLTVICMVAFYLDLPHLNPSSFVLNLHCCLNILYTPNFTMKGFVTCQGLASCQALGLN